MPFFCIFFLSFFWEIAAQNFAAGCTEFFRSCINILMYKGKFRKRNVGNPRIIRINTIFSTQITQMLQIFADFFLTTNANLKSQIPNLKSQIPFPNLDCFTVRASQFAMTWHNTFDFSVIIIRVNSCNSWITKKSC